ncbi:MAG: protein-disulfide isomerase [Candidatus Nitrosopumilus sp. bin_68KS]
MGRKERREREQKRDNYATRHSAEKRKQNLIAVGVLAVIVVIVGYAGWIFVNMTDNVPGGPENAGALGSEHAHAGILVSIFGDEFDFSAPAYQIKSSWIHFEGRDGTTVHKHATGVTLGYLFETLSLGLDDQCFVFQDGRSFCTNEDYKLVFYVNGEQLPDIRELEIQEDDKILIAYGGETPEEIDALLLKLENRELVK